MTEQEIIEVMNGPDCYANPAHDAWPHFVAHMADKQYGHEPLWDAWLWFEDGWDSAVDRHALVDSVVHVVVGSWHDGECGEEWMVAFTPSRVSAELSVIKFARERDSLETSMRAWREQNPQPLQGPVSEWLPKLREWQSREFAATLKLAEELLTHYIPETYLRLADVGDICYRVAWVSALKKVGETR